MNLESSMNYDQNIFKILTTVNFFIIVNLHLNKKISIIYIQFNLNTYLRYIFKYLF